MNPLFRERLALALSRLLASLDSFVIVTCNETDQFLQFAGSETKPLLFDLPTVDMLVGVRGRAERFFAKRSVKAEQRALYESAESADAGDKFCDMMEVFDVLLERDIEAGVALACQVFAEVFAVPKDATFRIESGEIDREAP